jgi:hypothetical protein
MFNRFDRKTQFLLITFLTGVVPACMTIYMSGGGMAQAAPMSYIDAERQSMADDSGPAADIVHCGGSIKK